MTCLRSSKIRLIPSKTKYPLGKHPNNLMPKKTSLGMGSEPKIQHIRNHLHYSNTLIRSTWYVIQHHLGGNSKRICRYPCSTRHTLTIQLVTISTSRPTNMRTPHMFKLPPPTMYSTSPTTSYMLAHRLQARTPYQTHATSCTTPWPSITTHFTTEVN